MKNTKSLLISLILLSTLNTNCVNAASVSSSFSPALVSTISTESFNSLLAKTDLNENDWMKKFKENFVVTILTMLVTGFGAGVVSAKFFLDFTKQVFTSESKLKELEKKEVDYDKLRGEYQKILEQYNDLIAKITYPQKGEKKEEVNQEAIFKGQVSRRLNLNEHLWLVVNPYNSHGWYPQNTEIAISSDNTWEHGTLIGQEQGDSGRNFNVVVVVANDNAHQAFNQYLKKGWETKEWPEESLPIGVIQLDAITVTRK